MERGIRFLRACLALVPLLAGCTFGVEAVELRKEASHESDGITLLREDLSHLDDVRVTGGDHGDVRAALISRGLIGEGERAQALEGLEVAFYLEGTILGVTSSFWAGRFRELLEPARLELDVPHTMDLELVLGSTSAHVSEAQGRVTIRGESGSVVLDGGDDLDIELLSGSIEAESRAARLRTDSGAMNLVIGEHLDAEARSGSIEAVLRGGGAAHTDSGSIEITLDGPLTEDLIVSANSGSVHIRMAEGVGARLDLDTGAGSLRVQAGSLDFRGDSFVGEVGTGLHTLQVRTGDGSIAIDAIDEGR